MFFFLFYFYCTYVQYCMIFHVYFDFDFDFICYFDFTFIARTDSVLQLYCILIDTIYLFIYFDF